jgi:uncharacterized repeat protein (TIGR04138 family)
VGSPVGVVAVSHTIDFKRMRELAPFPPEAYQFVREGLAHTVQRQHGQPESLIEDDSRHVSGQQLCMGIRDYAIEQYGKLAGTVLRHWGLRKTDDFGRIVFAMVDAGLMRTTDEDRLEDFENVFDFDEAFGTPGDAAATA